MHNCQLIRSTCASMTWLLRRLLIVYFQCLLQFFFCCLFFLTFLVIFSSCFVCSSCVAFSIWDNYRLWLGNWCQLHPLYMSKCTVGKPWLTYWGNKVKVKVTFIYRAPYNNLSWPKCFTWINNNKIQKINLTKTCNRHTKTTFVSPRSESLGEKVSFKSRFKNVQSFWRLDMQR